MTARTLTIHDDCEIVAGTLLAVEGDRLRIATDSGHVEVEVAAGHRFLAALGSEVRVYGLVKLCSEWARMGMETAQ